MYTIVFTEDAKKDLKELSKKALTEVSVFLLLILLSISERRHSSFAFEVPRECLR